jgi:hypothetical protein
MHLRRGSRSDAAGRTVYIIHRVHSWPRSYQCVMYYITHGLINYKDTKNKMSSFQKIDLKRAFLWQVFIRVSRLEIQSVMLVFQPNYGPSNLLYS